MWEPQRSRLMMLALATLALFAGATALAASFHRHEDALARSWYRRAGEVMKQQQPREAATYLRNALAFDRDNRVYRLQLARALVAGGERSQARAYLLALWEDEPGNGELNLLLARLASERGDPDEAARFYHGAIFGVWQQDPEAQRRQARRELINVLLRQERLAEAASQLLALAAESRREPATDVEIGRLFLAADAPDRALAHFTTALKADPKRAEAAEGAGNAALRMQQLRAAERYYERAAGLNGLSTTGSERLAILRIANALDPFAPSLRTGERVQRVQKTLQAAEELLRRCAAQRGVDLAAPAGEPAWLHEAAQQLSSFRSRSAVRALARSPEQREQAMQTAFTVAQRAGGECGLGGNELSALLLLANARAEETR